MKKYLGLIQDKEKQKEKCSLKNITGADLRFWYHIVQYIKNALRSVGFREAGFGVGGSSHSSLSSKAGLSYITYRP